MKCEKCGMSMKENELMCMVCGHPNSDRFKEVTNKSTQKAVLSFVIDNAVIKLTLPGNYSLGKSDSNGEIEILEKNSTALFTILHNSFEDFENQVSAIEYRFELDGYKIYSGITEVVNGKKFLFCKAVKDGKNFHIIYGEFTKKAIMMLVVSCENNDYDYIKKEADKLVGHFSKCEIEE